MLEFDNCIKNMYDHFITMRQILYLMNESDIQRNNRRSSAYWASE